MTDSGRAALYEALMASYDAAAQRASAIVRARPEARRLTDDQFYSSERLNLQVARLHRELFAAEHQPEHVAFFYDRASGHGQRKNTNRGRARLGDRGLPKRQRQLDSALRRLVAGQTVAVNVWWDGGQWLVWPRGFQPRDFAELTTSCLTAAEAVERLRARLESWPVAPDDGSDPDPWPTIGTIRPDQFVVSEVRRPVTIKAS